MIVDDNIEACINNISLGHCEKFEKEMQEGIISCYGRFDVQVCIN